MSHMFWGKAVNTTTYLFNKCPTKKLKNKVPEEAWSGRKPSVKHLKVFGSICYKYIPDANRSKLDDKSEKMILLGYHSTRAYKLYDPTTKKVRISRDVIVDENEAWNSETTTEIRNVNSHIFTESNQSEAFDEDMEEAENEIENVVENEDDQATQQVIRSHRNRKAPSRLEDCELLPDSAVNDEGELIHFGLLADVECNIPIFYRHYIGPS
jgi:hypothetical protein